MNQPIASQLTHAQPDWDKITTPFEGDVLHRKVLAEKMTAYLSRLKAGAVLAIDAPWGEGKSWFGRHWAAYLSAEEQNYRVVYIDAFEQDYIEDPFLLIATELAQLIKNNQTVKDSFIEKSSAVMKALLPLAATSLLNLITMMTIGKMHIADDIKEIIDGVQEDSEEAIGEWIKDKFKGHEAEKQTVKNFRKELEKIAKAEEKPIVIFIDELDRCRPDFAVKIIERIKHFFNVENVVFVLLLNREQLQNAVKGVYGAETDAATYLGKFVNFFFTLPKIESSSPYNSHLYKYAEEESKKYHNISIEFLDIFCPIAEHFELSLRDVEKALALYAFSGVNQHNLYSPFIIYASCLKIKYPIFYSRILANTPSIHRELSEDLAKAHHYQFKDMSRYSIFGAFNDWHQYMLTTTETTSYEELRSLYPHLAQLLPRGGLDIKTLFSVSLKKIDLSID